MKIELYTGMSCPACTALKGRLNKLELTDYEPRSTDMMEHRDALVALGFRSIPVLVKTDTEGGLVDTLQGNLATDAAYVEFFNHAG